MTPEPHVIDYRPSPRPTLGVEIELQILDPGTMALASRFDDLDEHLSEEERISFKRELIQSCLEINTRICESPAEAEADLRAKFARLASLAEKAGVRIASAGTHPFSHWKDQRISPVRRYHDLVENLQWVARRMGIFGLHVHVGVDDADKAVSVTNELVKFLPHLLALSANSPYWRGHDTGLASCRAKVFEALPQAGLPHFLRDWDDYRWLVERLIATGSISCLREIWWDVRPHPDFGTVEVRMCDAPSRLSEMVAIAALVQALVVKLGRDFDRGTPMPLMHESVIRQNKWRALRYGLEGELIDWERYETEPTRDAIRRLLAMLEKTAEELGTLGYFEEIERMVAGEGGAARQRRLLEETGEYAD
ncbi:MAG: glutamate--cysteine ligase, partial [Candidatus Methylomirabilis sp.]|nr:glutamate--cysteine ligase [Deltaproteobacteria bacterium]